MQTSLLVGTSDLGWWGSSRPEATVTAHFARAGVVHLRPVKPPRRLEAHAAFLRHSLWRLLGEKFAKM